MPLGDRDVEGDQSAAAQHSCADGFPDGVGKQQVPLSRVSPIAISTVLADLEALAGKVPARKK